MQYSAEYKKALIDRPRENVESSDWHGRIRAKYFKFTGEAGGGTKAYVVQLPAGRVRFLGDLSYMTNSAIVVGVGWGPYRDPVAQADVAESGNGLDSNKAASGGNLGTNVDATTKVFNSEGGVNIQLTLTAETDTAEGWIAYMVD